MTTYNRMIRATLKNRVVIEYLDGGSPYYATIDGTTITLNGDPAKVTELCHGDEIQLSGGTVKTLRATRTGLTLKATIPHTVREQPPMRGGTHSS